MSQAGILSLTDAPLPPSALTKFTLQSDDASPTTSIPSANNENLNTENTTVIFVGSGNTITMDFGLTSNLVMGTDAPFLTSGTDNTGVGQFVLEFITSGSTNSCFGWGAGSALTTGSNNVIIGAGAAGIASNMNESVVVGTGAMTGYTGSSQSLNTAIGYGVLGNLTTGRYNIALGQSTGLNYTSSESSNILIGSLGVVAESNAIRIGTQGSAIGNQNTCYIAGIEGVSVSNKNIVTINTSTGQMGSDATVALAQGGTNANLTASNGGIFYSTASAGAILAGTSTAGQILQSGASAAPSWSTATYPATAGSSGNVLKSDGTNVVSSSFVGNRVLIQTQDASNSASINFTTGISSTYTNYVLTINNYLPANTGGRLTLQYSTDGGVTWLSTNYLSGNTFSNSSTPGTISGSTSLTTGVILMGSVDNSYGTGAGEYKIFDLTNGSYPKVYGTAVYGLSSTAVRALLFSSSSNTTINALQVIQSAGNITSGTFKLYGIVK